jgi:hypothetical protein
MFQGSEAKKKFYASSLLENDVTSVESLKEQLEKNVNLLDDFPPLAAEELVKCLIRDHDLSPSCPAAATYVKSSFTVSSLNLDKPYIFSHAFSCLSGELLVSQRRQVRRAVAGWPETRPRRAGLCWR